jgi:hypothetical protein
MAQRRHLSAGLKPPDPKAEKAFVFSGKAEDIPPPVVPGAAQPAPREAKGQPSAGRLPLTTRIRTDYAQALKRASLERQLTGEMPNSLQDILEDALGPWLRTHGYVK